MDNQLRDINFTGGIRSEDIQYNFETIKDIIDRERLRVGGYGIVEGFNISILTGEEIINNKEVKVSQGILINKDGEEVIVEEQLIEIFPPEYVEIKLIDTASALTVNGDGQIILPHIPYSSEKPGYMDISHYQTNTPNTELIIKDASDPSINIVPISITSNIVTVQQSIWAGKKVFVEYKYAQNRLDTILVNKDGEYVIEESVQSTSPSHIDLDREDEYFIIGFILTEIGEDITLEKYEMHRTFRKVYVDENNELYLNGKKYLGEQFISFTEILNPKIGDMWYDKESNRLLVYDDKDGIIGWVPVGEDTSRYSRESKIFAPEDMPLDMKTFLFGEDEPNLKFVPGHNQLEVIIDNTPIMSDQFIEIIDEEASEYINSGIGFRLNNELDKASHVEVKILHSVQQEILRKTFQRTASFVEEGNETYSELNVLKIFETNKEYVMGHNQLEVFHNGKKLIKNNQFYEILNETEEYNVEHEGLSSKHFKLSIDLEANDSIQHKILKTVYSYDSLSELIDDIKISADNSAEAVFNIQDNLSNFESQTNNSIGLINNKIDSIETQLEEQDNFIRKDEQITIDNLPEEIKNKIIDGQFTQLYPADATIDVLGLKITDFILVFYYNASNFSTRILFKDQQYNLIDGEGKVTISLEPSFVNINNSVYVTAIKLGT